MLIADDAIFDGIFSRCFLGLLPTLDRRTRPSSSLLPRHGTKQKHDGRKHVKLLVIVRSSMMIPYTT
jgi:hypothetical protein